MLYVYNERDPGRLNVQDCETFISSSDESELERFHFLIAAICVYIYNYVNSSFANVYIYIYISSFTVYCDSGVSYSWGCQDIQSPCRVNTTFFCCTSIASINIYLYISICVNIYIRKVCAGIQVAHLYMYVYTFTHKIANANTMSKHTFNYIYVYIYI